MAQGLPPTLSRLLNAREPDERDREWSQFVSEFSGLVLHVARSRRGDRDEIMDRYAYVLEKLRADDMRRLRSCSEIGSGSFTTWFVVVVRRLCVDHARERFGRIGTGTPDARQQRARLVLLQGSAYDDEVLPDPLPLPDEFAYGGEQRRALRAAVADLDEPDQRLLSMRFRDELPVATIAQELGFPTVFHVYRRLNRLLERLRASLLRSGLDDAAL